VRLRRMRWPSRVDDTWDLGRLRRRSNTVSGEFVRSRGPCPDRAQRGRDKAHDSGRIHLTPYSRVMLRSGSSAPRSIRPGRDWPDRETSTACRLLDPVRAADRARSESAG